MARTIVKIEFNQAGFAALAKGAAVLADLTRRGEAIAAAAGDGFEARPSIGRTRARVVVITATPEAMIAEASDKALTSAIGAGRG